jgi:hypothetical protein
VSSICASRLTKAVFAASSLRIFTNARMTKTLTRDPRSLARFPSGLCGLSNGVPARRIHLHRARAVEDVRGLERTVFGERVRQVFHVLAALQGHSL